MEHVKTIVGAMFSWIIFPVLVVFGLHFFVFQPYHVVGSSMAETLHNGDYLIISKLSRTFQGGSYLPKRGEIIVFRFPKNPSQTFIKRVIGLPGDRVVVENGTVTVFNDEHPDGFNPDTAYEPAGATTLIGTDETVRAGHVFVMGDNRNPNMSSDSRDWGEVPVQNIIGEAKMRLLPLNGLKGL
jgi:signal peptidase I